MKRFIECESTGFDMKLHTSSAVPKLITPEGLDLDRQDYLFNQIREFCRPGTEDLVCPAPQNGDKRRRKN